ARDCSGNLSPPVSQTITVVDSTPPSISPAGANATIECPTAPSFTPPTANDPCDANPSVVEVSDNTTPGSCAGVYTRTKTWRRRQPERPGEPDDHGGRHDVADDRRGGSRHDDRVPDGTFVHAADGQRHVRCEPVDRGSQRQHHAGQLRRRLHAHQDLAGP